MNKVCPDPCCSAIFHNCKKKPGNSGYWINVETARRVPKFGGEKRFVFNDLAFGIWWKTLPEEKFMIMNIIEKFNGRNLSHIYEFCVLVEKQPRKYHQLARLFLDVKNYNIHLGSNYNRDAFLSGEECERLGKGVLMIPHKAFGTFSVCYKLFSYSVCDGGIFDCPNEGRVKMEWLVFMYEQLSRNNCFSTKEWEVKSK